LRGAEGLGLKQSCIAGKESQIMEFTSFQPIQIGKETRYTRTFINGLGQSISDTIYKMPDNENWYMVRHFACSSDIYGPFLTKEKAEHFATGKPYQD
jgi:hypothetical protein